MLQHLQGGTAVENAVAALRSFADKSQPDSPIRKLINEPLLEWFNAQAAAGRTTDLIALFRDADRARSLLQLNLQSAATRAQLATNELKALKGKSAPDAVRWTLPTITGRVVLQDVRTRMTPGAQGLADMGFVFAVHTSTTPKDLYWALDAALPTGFDGRLIGQPIRITSYQVQQAVSAKQRSEYGTTLCAFLSVNVRMAMTRARAIVPAVTA